jgi:galactokinase
MSTAPIPATEVHDPAETARRQFTARFRQPPRWLAAAPGRVNLIGEHTDYNEGFVLPMAIDRETVVAAALNGRNIIRLETSFADKPVEIDPARLTPGSHTSWSDYAAGVIAGFQLLGQKIPGFDAFVDSSVPAGGGLSSSAALEVATATLLEAITGRSLDPVGKALLCQKAEHDYVGVPCGIMDQMASVCGREDHLLLLDCRSRETRLVPFNDPSVAVLVINTNVRHELSGGEYALRRTQCETAAHALDVASLRDVTEPMLLAGRSKMDSTTFRRARHVVSEIARTLKAADAVAASRWEEVGQLMQASHASLRDDYKVSCPELEVVVDLASAPKMKSSIYGCRMTGGGFGGCAIALVRRDAADAVSASIATDYHKRTGIEPSLFLTRPGDGARLLA